VMIRKTTNAIRRGLALALLSALLVGAITPVAAGAQATSPTCDQYSSTNCQQINNNGGGGAAMLMIALVVSLVVYAISFLLIRLLSRYRELCADRAGAFLTGRPSALASALTKITGDISRIPSKDLRASQPMNAFFIAPAISGISLRTLTSTHPSLEQRLEELAKVAKELGQPIDGGFLPPAS